ncbi:hypothetical protein F3J44_14320 [Pantoea sp. Tr-811]|uniref:hypothetical protein n=1 Tax=Pantoea sp. Tr-811 TaxID=2608361 RepID=UPI00141E0E18|nr:hypothetical protein [Pantoea sp. Tr-811]NIF27541.1 hypothetical protein [Pantoea sp. Tr-811]
MLAAILNGKRRGSGVEGKHSSLGDATGAEDILTATIVERLIYLPESVRDRFFSQLLGPDRSIGTLEDFEFWPSWWLDGRRVEPDVVLYGSERTLLIEAKRHDDLQQQYAVQLANELRAGWAGKQLGEGAILLTLGGLQDYTQKSIAELESQIERELSGAGSDYELACCSWYQLFQALEAAISNASSDSSPGLQRLLDDVAAAYEWHGLRITPRRWLGQLAPVSIDATRSPVFAPGIVSDKRIPSCVATSRFLSDLSEPSIQFTQFPIARWS